MLLGRKAMTNLDSILKSRDFTDQILSSEMYDFSSSHVWIWELDHKESWAPKYWCSWTVVFEKTVESPLVCKEIKPVYPKGNQSWIFIERTDAEAGSPILCHLTWRTDSLEKPWCSERLRTRGKGMTEDEMVGCHHRLDGHKLEQVLGAIDGQGSLACCSPWGCEGSAMTERLNW